MDVFVNCPFDDSYAPIADAITFTIVDCGFRPRSALERLDASEVRLEKIYELISQSTYAIHDLSRNALNDQAAASRFNMPLELGIFLGAKYYGGEPHAKKRCLIFDQSPYNYQKYISDISGQDIATHNNDPRIVVRETRNWLSYLPGSKPLPSPSVVFDRYSRFLNELKYTCSEALQKPEELTFTEFAAHASFFCQNKEDALLSGMEKSWGMKLVNPRLPLITEAIRNLSSEEDDFLTLQKAGAGSTFIQTHRIENGNFYLEFQEGWMENGMKIDCVDSATVVNLFHKFRDWDQSFRDHPAWQKNEWYRGG